MKTAQKMLVAGALVASLSLGVVSAFAKSEPKRVDQPKVAAYTLNRKVNEYEGQHRNKHVNEYEGQHRNKHVNEYEGQHR